MSAAGYLFPHSQTAEQLVSTLRVAESSLELTTGIVDTAHENTLAGWDLAEDSFCALAPKTYGQLTEMAATDR